MTNFPKLVYPLDRRLLSRDDGLLLLNYDILWRWHNALLPTVGTLTAIEATNLDGDTQVNLNELRKIICSWPEGRQRFENQSGETWIT